MVDKIFASKKKIIPAKPFVIDFWRRDFGATWLSFERKAINEFSKVNPGEKVSISGYVKWVGKSIFVLVPTLFSNQTYLTCVNYADKKPLENSYIRLSGNAKFDRLKPYPESPESTAPD